MEKIKNFEKKRAKIRLKIARKIANYIKILNEIILERPVVPCGL
jgi:hypothetical protein